MNDARRGIIVTQPDIGAGKDFGGRGPWRMQGPVRQGGKFRDPAPHVVAGRIETLSLRDRIEDTEIRRGIGAAAGRPLPAQGVVGEIGIN